MIAKKMYHVLFIFHHKTLILSYCSSKKKIIFNNITISVIQKSHMNIDTKKKDKRSNSVQQSKESHILTRQKYISHLRTDVLQQHWKIGSTYQKEMKVC